MKSKIENSQLEWMRHEDVTAVIMSPNPPHPWFPAYKRESDDSYSITWFSALIPLEKVSAQLEDVEWDLYPNEGKPSLITYRFPDMEPKTVYYQYGNDKGFEPLVVLEEFHQLRDSRLTLVQEFALFHQLFYERSEGCFLHFDENGDQSLATRHSNCGLEIRTDLVRKYCDEKQMALALFVESFRYHDISENSLSEKIDSTPTIGPSYIFQLVATDERDERNPKLQSVSVLTGKRYILPNPRGHLGSEGNEIFQDFIIGSRPEEGKRTFTCDPSKLADGFGRNKGAPSYLTPVHFRKEVLTKYFSDPEKYEINDGILRCGGLWSLQIDNDHPERVAVFLGDLGRDLSESERHYWKSFNIEPDGQTLSETSFRRNYLAEFTDPTSPDLVFKSACTKFNTAFLKAYGWSLFRPLHEEDTYAFITLHMPAKDSHFVFDTQVLLLSKLMVEAINVKEIASRHEHAKGLSSIEALKLFLEETGITNVGPQLAFLRKLYGFRSQSSAHGKGSDYERLAAKFRIKERGHRKVFRDLLEEGIEFIEFLETSLLKFDSIRQKQTNKHMSSDLGNDD